VLFWESKNRVKLALSQNVRATCSRHMWREAL
jgi:hypothetical protein